MTVNDADRGRRKHHRRDASDHHGPGNYNVNVGKSGSVANIAGTININSTGNGKARLNVNSSADLGGTVTVTNRYLRGSWGRPD